MGHNVEFIIKKRKRKQRNARKKVTAAFDRINVSRK
jgi:hypothetical protein